VEAKWVVRSKDRTRSNLHWLRFLARQTYIGCSKRRYSDRSRDDQAIDPPMQQVGEDFVGVVVLKRDV
jgi:hypothetical protein